MNNESITELDVEIKKIEAEIKQKEALEAKLIQLNSLLLKIYDEKKRKTILKKISQIKSKLQKLDGSVVKKNINDLVKKHQRYNTKQEQLNVELQYLYDYYLVKGEVTLFAAPPSNGKSLISLKLADLLLSQNKIQYVYYFDFDNGFVTLKQRKLDEIQKKHGDNLLYIHPSNIDETEFNDTIADLINCDLSDVLIVFDTTKNFIKGDRDKNRDVSRLMKMFKKLRDAGGTVLLLHHTNKPKADLDYLTYAGSSAWEEDTSNAFILQKNDYKSTFLFKEFKKRVGDIRDIAFKIENDEIVEVDFEEASETEEDQQIRNEVIYFIANNPKCTYSQILQHVTGMGYSKDKVNKVIQSGKSKHWQAVKNKAKQNRDEYILIQTENISKKVEITDFVSDNTDNSDNSYFSGIEERKESQIESDNYRDLLRVEQNMNIDIPT
jgi:replicative DNA helicase